MRVRLVRVPRPNVAEEVEVREGATVLEALGRLDVPPDAVVVLRGPTPIPLDAPVVAEETLRVLTVYSGG